MRKKSEKNLQNFYRQLNNAKSDIRNKNLYELILSRVIGKNVLDIGSGSGNFLNILKGVGFNAEGVEPDKNLVDLSKQTHKNLPKMHSLKAEEADTINKKFDTITMIDVLEHIDNDVMVLKKNKKILNKNGRLVILVPAYQFLFSDRDKKIGHYRRYGAGELKNKLMQSGYEIQELRFWNALGFFVYLLFEKLIKKPVSSTSLRTGKKQGFFKSIIHKLLDWWIRDVENKTNFGFGLSLICVATKKI